MLGWSLIKILMGCKNIPQTQTFDTVLYKDTPLSRRTILILTHFTQIHFWSANGGRWKYFPRGVTFASSGVLNGSPHYLVTHNNANAAGASNEDSDKERTGFVARSRSEGLTQERSYSGTINRQRCSFNSMRSRMSCGGWASASLMKCRNCSGKG